MEIKKSPKADLEAKRPAVLLACFAVAAALFFFALEWSIRPVAHSGDIHPDTVARGSVLMPGSPLVSREEMDRLFTDETPEAQTMEEEIAATEEEPEELVDEMPSFPGGMGVCLKYLSTHTRYPDDARAKGIQGRVLVQFVVGKDGKIEEAEVVRTVYPSLDREALRVIRSMPAWVPGRLYGKAVKVKYILPVTFKIH